MTFKSKPYGPDRQDGRSEAQKKAHDRNWRIFKLRGLDAQARLLSGTRRDLFRRLLDEELAAIGAKTQTQHEADTRAKWLGVDETDPPF